MSRKSVNKAMARRHTPQIEAILRALMAAETHITAEEIFEEARKDAPGMSRPLPPM